MLFKPEEICYTTSIIILFLTIIMQSYIEGDRPLKFSNRAKASNLSPIRKFYPYTVEAEKVGKKIYYMNIGQPDIHTPATYLDSIRDFRNPVLEYAPSAGIPVLIEAVRKYYRGIGIEYGAEDIIITNGGSEGLLFTLMSILDEGDEVLIPEPFYPSYNTFVAMTGASIVPIPTYVEEGYHYASREKLLEKITPNTKVILITNPGNPTGTVLTRSEVRMILDLAIEHDLFVVADEVYREFVYGDDPHASVGEFQDAADHVVIIDSVSKRFSACGARVGSLITKNAELREHVIKFCQARLSVPTLDQVGSAALYNISSDYFAEAREEYRRRRDTVYRKLSRMNGVVCGEPMGAFYVTCEIPVDDAEKFQVWLLTEYNNEGETIMFAPVKSFYATPGKGVREIRLSYVINQQALNRAMDILEDALAKYPNRTI